MLQCGLQPCGPLATAPYMSLPIRHQKRLDCTAVGAEARMKPPETQSDANEESHTYRSSHVIALSSQPGISAQLANPLRCRRLRKLLCLRRQNRGGVWNKRLTCSDGSRVDTLLLFSYSLLAVQHFLQFPLFVAAGSELYSCVSALPLMQEGRVDVK